MVLWVCLPLAPQPSCGSVQFIAHQVETQGSLNQRNIVSQRHAMEPRDDSDPQLSMGRVVYRVGVVCWVGSPAEHGWGCI